MSNKKYAAKETTFWKFIQENEIEIPIIQRDYAQGRQGKESLRISFLSDLKNALDSKNVLKLDFVYGSIEYSKGHQIINPLDGQQRLTTLWLLHWYIALMSNKLNDNVCEVLEKFTYETRVSSRDFCRNLCKPEYFYKYNEYRQGEQRRVVDYITSRTWFYSAWKQDPTIQSMLRMLGGTKIGDSMNREDMIDGIEEIFPVDSPFEKYWELLVADDTPIVFYQLPLNDFGLSDDLYIKMNARGKQLTSFENFKADLVGYIRDRARENPQDWDDLLDEKIGVPIKLDTVWTDIFWKNKSNGNKIDEIYFAFVNRLFWNDLFIASKVDKSYVLDISKDENGLTKENNNLSYKYLNNSESSISDFDTTISYQGLDVYKFFYGEIPKSLFTKLQNILDSYAKYMHEQINLCCTWDNNFRFIPEYETLNGKNIEIEDRTKNKILKVTHLTQVHRVVFYAVCKYFSEDNSDNSIVEVDSLRRWMRVVWNLVSGEGTDGRPQIRSLQAVRNAIDFISRLNSHDVYKSLIDCNESLNNSDFDERCKEEIEKAKQILNDDKSGLRNYYGVNADNYKTWEEIIVKAENYAFFKGTIRFLFLDETGNVNWNCFETKWSKVQTYFDKDGIKTDYRVPLTKSLVIQCDNWSEQLYDKQIFNSNGPTWRWILSAKNWTRPINNIFMGNDIIASKCNNDEMANKYFTPLLEKLPYEDMINKVPNGRFKFHRRLGFYYNKSDAMTFDWNDFHRNQILGELKNDKINVDAEASGEFWWGWSINFKYKDISFQWHRDNYVRIIDESSDPKLRSNDDVHDKKENWYYFEAENINDTNLFLQKLDNLIAQAFPDNTSVCD